MTDMDRLETFKVINGLTLALIVLGLIFSLPPLIYSGAGLLAASLIPPAARLLAFFWKKLTKFLGLLVSRVVLALVYYLVLTPVALMYRLFNSDPLMLDREGRESYFRERNKTYEPEDFEKIW